MLSDNSFPKTPNIITEVGNQLHKTPNYIK